MQLSIAEMARHLDLPQTTLLRWIRQGHIPLQQRGDTCEYNPLVLERWARQHRLTIPLNPHACDTVEPEASNDLLTAMQRGGVYYDIGGQTVADVLEQAVAHLPELPNAPVRRELLEVLLAREALASTGVGRGVAIPHPRHPRLELFPKSQVTTFFLKQAIDFKAVDQQPVFVMFLLLSPCLKSHLNLLSQLSFCVRSSTFVQQLRQRPIQTEFYAAVAACADREVKKGESDEQ